MTVRFPLRAFTSARSFSVLYLLIWGAAFASAPSVPTDDRSVDSENWDGLLGHAYNAPQAPLQGHGSPQAPLFTESAAEDHTHERTEDGVSSSQSTYAALLDAVSVMQSHFYSVPHGTWPDAIDWTAAVMGTQISAGLAAMSQYTSLADLTSPHAYSHENNINRYFTQITSFYFGENAFELRTQAYDDMLWVVLGWLESIQFINLHSNLHYAPVPSQRQHDSQNLSWYARQFIPQFAHRARLFYDLASKGWDTSLCGGGMIWNPYLAPYKNAITNQLFITASVSMYLYFPGDSNASPYHAATPTSPSPHQSPLKEARTPPAKAHDSRYLDNAIAAYDWLQSSHMRNPAGLYTDGFHIRGWRGGHHGSNGTGLCDLRDDKVYTYNQGVILSGLRGLWEATGQITYLEDGHGLIEDVITATGWHERDTDQRYRWAGLGRGGVLEEQCDWSGSCSQDSQTFKGIFFHHFSAFCAPLPSQTAGDDDDVGDGGRPWLGDEATRALHRQSCDGYAAWVERNARAAWVTRDEEGVFGGWWGRAARFGGQGQDDDGHDDGGGEGAEAELDAPPQDVGTDYRNDGVPFDDIWRLPSSAAEHAASSIAHPPGKVTTGPPASANDLNDRGRGRTVETQSGGVAVVRALWKLMDSRGRDRDGDVVDELLDEL